jgi:uncharacterized protein
VLIAIISDTHLSGGGRLPESCTRRLRAAELILHAGDISTVAFLSELAELGPPLQAVHGNVDEAALHELLPGAIELDVAGVPIAMTHDAGPARGRLARMRERFPRASAVVFGHSHAPLREEDAGGFQIFNPGSPTQRRRAPAHTMGVAVAQEGRVVFDHVVL